MVAPYITPKTEGNDTVSYFQWDILKTKAQLMSKSALGRIPRGKWEDLEDITEVFDKNIFYEPAVSCVEFDSTFKFY